MKLVMYGAGAIGRGFIGPLFAAAGYQVVFVDVNQRLVTELHRRGGYPLTIAANPPYEIPVTGIRAIDGRNEDTVAAEIADCDILATSLGAAILPQVVPIIGRGLLLRERSGRPLDILICENLKDSARQLRGWLSQFLPADKQQVLSLCGLVETAIGRMVPVGVDSADPLAITVEAYDFLPVDSAAFLGPIPAIPQLVPFSPFAFYEERKLYLHNMGHASCAYLGLLEGHAYIADAVADPAIRLIVQNAMEESALALSLAYGVSYGELHAHLLDLLHRFGNTALGDTCERVARDPLRKLGPDDRFAGAVTNCRGQGIAPVCVSIGFAAALLRQTTDIEQAQVLANSHCGLPVADAETILALYCALRDHGSVTAFSVAENLRHSLNGNRI